MSNNEHLALLKSDVWAWNIWRVNSRSEQPDLSRANLTLAPLRRADLTGANLTEVDLSMADFTRADLRRADLRGANLTGALLRMADLTTADLRRANLTGTLLTEVDLTGANLSGTDLSRTRLFWAHLNKTNLYQTDLRGTQMSACGFADIDLSQAIGLDEVKHLGPSTLGIDTIYRSNGKITEAFLRGAGVPDNFITFARSLVGKAIESYSCFISYSSKDQNFAARLHAHLRAKNLRVWFAPEDLKIGERIEDRIEESIRLYDKVLIVLSEASVQSRWVERGVNAARAREDREKRMVLFPIRIDDAVMNTPQPWAADIRRSRHIGDFSHWKDHDSYQAALNRLLRDLAPDQP